MPKIKTIRSDILKEKEVIKTIYDCSEPDVKAIASIMWMTGCRISEVLLLKLVDIKNHDDYIEFNMPTMKQRSVVLPRRRLLIPKSSIFYPYIRDYINSIHPKFDERQVFECTSWHVWYVLKKANPNIYPHLFRHSAATRLSEKVDVFDLKYQFGWKKIEMAMKYVHRQKSPFNVLSALKEYDDVPETDYKEEIKEKFTNDGIEDIINENNDENIEEDSKKDDDNDIHKKIHKENKGNKSLF